MKSTMKHQFKTDGNYCFNSLTICNFTFRLLQDCVQVEVYCFFSPSESEFSIFFTSIKAALVARKGLPNSSGACVSSYMSMITKSIGKMNFPTLISTSSRTPSGCAIVLFTIYKVIDVGVSSPKLSLLTIDKGIKLMRAPESHKAFLNSKFPMV